MAVTVNLREVFPSDSQAGLTEKLNFNFNQLLTLGLGEPGPQGEQGETGPIGPIGPVGEQGDRGSLIYAENSVNVPVGDDSPVLNSLPGDLFVNSQKIFHKEGDNSWTEIVNFQGLVNNSALSDIYKVFQIGTGDGDAGSKHAKLLRYYGIDKNNALNEGVTTHPQGYVPANGNATQLVLSNFNELKTYRISGGVLVANSSESDNIFEYTAINKIIAYLPAENVTDYRHQLELGSVDGYSVTAGGSSQLYVLTPTEQNLKFRKYRVQANTLPGGFYNRADLDLSGPLNSGNSINGEIALTVNKKVANLVQYFQMAISTQPVIQQRTGVDFKTDGLIITRSGLQHITFGFATDNTNMVRLDFTSNMNQLVIKDATKFQFSNGNTTITQTDTSKTIGLGTAVVVGNNRLTQGLPFPTSPNLSSDANTLDEYKEGTWTPVIEFTHTIPAGNDTNGGSNYLTSNPVGRYIKIGQYVYAEFSIRLKYMLDSGLSLSQQNPIYLGFTDAAHFTPGGERYQIQIAGLPYSPIGNGFFDIKLQGLSTLVSPLREAMLHAYIDLGNSATTEDIPAIVPGSMFGRLACTGNSAGSAKIRLHGHRYVSTTAKPNAVRSNVMLYDFLRNYTTNSNDWTIISGSGWFLSNGDNCGAAETSEFPSGGGGGGPQS